MLFDFHVAVDSLQGAYRSQWERGRLMDQSSCVAWCCYRDLGRNVLGENLTGFVTNPGAVEGTQESLGR